MDDCIFCKVVSGEIPHFKIYEDDSAVAFLDINPVNPGHTLVVSKQHHPLVWDMPDDMYGRVMAAAKKVAKRIAEVLKPGRVGEAIEGFDVEHAHIHLIPIEEGFEKELTKPKTDKKSEEDLTAMAERLRF